MRLHNIIRKIVKTTRKRGFATYYGGPNSPVYLAMIKYKINCDERYRRQCCKILQDKSVPLPVRAIRNRAVCDRRILDTFEIFRHDYMFIVVRFNEIDKHFVNTLPIEQN